MPAERNPSGVEVRGEFVVEDIIMYVLWLFYSLSVSDLSNVHSISFLIFFLFGSFLLVVLFALVRWWVVFGQKQWKTKC